MIETSELRYSTAGDGDVIDMTADLRGIVGGSSVDQGTIVAFVRGSTAALTTMEFEPGGIADLGEMLERVIPADRDYAHNRLNHDTNSHAHQRASVIGPSEAIPIVDGAMTLGTWQQLVLIDFDDRPRERTVIVQVIS